jgi:hypothetical protein
LPTALPAVLFSPSRGLFIFVPVLVFVFYLAIRYWRTIPYPRLALLALSMIALHVLLIALWPSWWGGYCYGPRLLTDAVPWMTLFAILVVAAHFADHSAKHFTRIELTAGFALLALSIVINGKGGTLVVDGRME